MVGNEHDGWESEDGFDDDYNFDEEFSDDDEPKEVFGMYCCWSKSRAPLYCRLGSKIKIPLVSLPVQANSFTPCKRIAVHFLAELQLKMKLTEVVCSKKNGRKRNRAEPLIVTVDELGVNKRAGQLLQFFRHRAVPKCFEVIISPEKSAFQFEIFVKERELRSADQESVCVKSKGVAENIINIISIFYPNLVASREENVEPIGREDCEKFFRAIRAKRSAPAQWKLQTTSLVPSLRPYQEDAARFMLSRELHPQVELPMLADAFIVLPTDPPLHFSPVTAWMSRGPPPTFGCPPGGILADEMGLGKTVETLALILSHRRGQTVEVETKAHTEPNVIRLLVDELVSTVVAAIDSRAVLASQSSQKVRNITYFTSFEEETPKKRNKFNRFMEEKPAAPAAIDCVQCGVRCNQERVFWNAFPSSGIEFLCPDCICNQIIPKSIDATLIIAPSTICHQWYEEVKRHVRDDVAVDIYRGVAVEGYKHPEYLASKQVVICAFETLANEVHFIDSNNKNVSLRRPKRNRVSSSPLLGVEWWRICVDEAQMIEGASGIVSKMCWRLAAVNRWCISGTPVGNSLEGLYGLLSFIGLEPFCYQSWWSNGLWLPYTLGDSLPLEAVFANILWRNTKEDVLDQLFPPPRGSEMTVLRFTPIEEQFYREVLTMARRRAQEKAHLRAVEGGEWALDMNLSELNGKDFDRLLEPFQCVRKFIVHPGLRLSKAKQKFATGDAIHEELIRITTQQVEESQRSILLHYNGLAGLCWLAKTFHQAATHYRMAIAAMNLLETTNTRLGLAARRGAYRMLRSDKLQKIHTLNGIVDLLKVAEVNVSMDIDEATRKLKETESEYSEQSLENMKSAELALVEALQKFGDFSKKSSNLIGWICEVAKVAQRERVDEAVVESVRSALFDNRRDDFPARNAVGVSVVVVRLWDKVVDCVTKLVDFSKTLIRNEGPYGDPRADTIDKAIKCHLADTVNRLNTCFLCAYDKQTKALESLLYVDEPSKKQVRDENEEEVEPGTGGARKASNMELVMKAVNGVISRLQRNIPSGAISRQVLDMAKECFAFLELCKAILAAAKQFFITFNEVAARTDELRQCKLRLQYPSQEDIDRYKSGTLPKNFILKGTEKLTQQMHLNSVFTEKMSQTRLLAKLRYLSTLKNVGAGQDCPVCLDALGRSWIVLPCAHCVCPRCYNRMFGTVCPVCRENFPRNGVSYVELPDSASQLHFLDSENVTLKTDVSVKLNAVVRRVLSIRERDPWSKTLLFTSLPDIVPIICRTLADNSVLFRRFDSSANRQKVLADFRNDPNISVLVMLISSGARGLNLTVANNIIFVEPQLDTAQLAQAIGRIDRIGQNRATMIHHFVVYGSVEEQIFHKASNSQQSQWTVNAILDLLDSDVKKLNNLNLANRHEAGGAHVITTGGISH